MKVSGFTFVKNAVQYHYPVVESIKSMLPLCDEVIVNAGLPDTDGTLNLLRKNIKNNKVRIIKTPWDPEFKVKSRILAQQTNLALYQCRGDWCLYLQADEVFHEADYKNIREAMKQHLHDNRVQGLLFDYIHFYGSYKTYVRSYHWYRREIRVIKNHLGITSWRDAQSFRVDGRKLSVKTANARIFHYGWVRPPEAMLAKKQFHDSLHHGSKADTEQKQKHEIFWEFVDQIDPFMIAEFNKTHPRIMKEKVKKWPYDFDKNKSRHKLTGQDIRYRSSDIFANITGIRLGEYKNFKLLK